MGVQASGDITELVSILGAREGNEKAQFLPFRDAQSNKVDWQVETTTEIVNNKQE